MPPLRDFVTQMNELLAQQSATKKVLASVVLVGCLVFGATQLFKYGRSIEYETLFAGLDAQSAKILTDRLKTDAPGTPFTVTEADRGWTIKVPAGRVADLRLDLAPTIEAGGGKVGWELFDKSAIGITDFAQKINRQRAIEGELARTIQSIDVVKTATVRLAIPEESVFVSEQAQPKAAVVVELYPKTTLPRNKVEAIQAIVAGSIEELTRENVTVADTTGRLLSRPKGEEDTGADLDQRAMLVEQQEKQKKAYERYLEEKIQTALAKIFGQNHVSAQVNVDFDFTVKEVNELKYSPKNVPVAESLTKSVEMKEGITAEGIAGASAHIPPEGATSGGTTVRVAPPVSSEEKVTNYNVGKTETKTLYPPYQIRRITAAVLVDDMPVEKRDEKGNIIEQTRQKLEPTQLAALEESVKQIINYSEERPGGLSDAVKVTNMTFRPPEELTPEETVTKLQKHQMIVTAVRYGVLALLALLVLLFLVRPLMRIIAPPPARRPVLLEGRRPAALAGPESVQALPGAAAGPEALAGAGALAGLPQPATPGEALSARQAALDTEILQLAKENPKKVSLVLRAWMES